MTPEFRPIDQARFEEALKRFDEANAADPNQVDFEGSPRPREWAHAHWLSDWLQKLDPSASETLRLAARCQHLRRWEIPRESYPMTRAGYLKWREDLKHFHAQKAAEILRDVGYPEDVVTRVQSLNLKTNLKSDPEVQTLEDALCLVFLEHQLGPLAEKAGAEKVINALQKTWKKMSARGREQALQLPFTEAEKSLVEAALSSQGS